MKHLPFIILLIVLTIYLGLKTLPENGWGGWLAGDGDANTLLSLKYWAMDGIIHHKLLFIPIGYSKITEYLDYPEMRHLTKGTVTGGLVGRRLYYTHYPSGYLLPYAWLMKIGVIDRYWLRLFSLLLSFLALTLFYWFFNLISKNSLISFLAVLYYAISTMFLDYADAITSQPLDDLFRVIILVVGLLAICRYSHLNNFKNYKFYNILIWLLYFLFSFSSYDFTLFVFVWLIGLEIIQFIVNNYQSQISVIEKLKLFSWKKIIFFASAPILAFVLQLLQNYWYFGNWHEVWLDMMGAAAAKAYTGNGFVHFLNIFYPFSLMTGLEIFWAAFFVFVLFIILWKLRYLENATSILIVLFLAGAIYPFLMVSAGRFSYQGRQMMPLISFLVGTATFFVIRVFKDKMFCKGINIVLCGFLIISVSFLWGSQIYRTVQYIYDWPNNKADNNVIQLGKYLKLIKNGDSAVFYQGSKLPVSFVTEYYFDMPLFSFDKGENLIKDFLWLRNNSKYPFEAIIITDREEINNRIRKLLSEQKIDKIGDNQIIQGEYVFKIVP